MKWSFYELTVSSTIGDDDDDHGDDDDTWTKPVYQKKQKKEAWNVYVLRIVFVDVVVGPLYNSNPVNCLLIALQRETQTLCPARRQDLQDPPHLVYEYASIHDMILVFQVLGHWYEVERSFYLPEIASGCTTFEFQPYNKADLSKFNNFKLEVSIKTVNRM